MPSEIKGEIASYIRKTGNEFGTTTRRPRRIGWLDTVVLRHTKRTSGLSYLAITLLDVLSTVETLKIVVSYNYKGQIIDRIPAEISAYEQCKPNYITMPGWHEDITNVKTFAELPKNAQNYLNKICELVGVPLGVFSVGPDRKQTISIEKIFKGGKS